LISWMKRELDNDVEEKCVCGADDNSPETPPVPRLCVTLRTLEQIAAGIKPARMIRKSTHTT
jgi:hypothetical protein